MRQVDFQEPVASLVFHCYCAGLPCRRLSPRQADPTARRPELASAFLGVTRADERVGRCRSTSPIQIHAGDLGRLIDSPEEGREAAPSYIESVGGKLHGFWYAFGPHDGYTLWEASDNVSMAAVALASGAGGALSPLETTVLLTIEETMDAMRRARQVRYRPPGT